MGAAVVSGVDAPPILEPSEPCSLSCGAACRGRRHGGSRPSDWISRGCRRRGRALPGRRGTNWRRSPRPPEVAWPWAGQAPSAPRPCSRSSAPRFRSMTSGRPRPSQTACSLEFRPPLVRPIRRGTGPFLKRLRSPARCAFRCVASIIIRSGLPPLPRQFGETMSEHAHGARANELIVDCLVRAILWRRVAPAQPLSKTQTRSRFTILNQFVELCDAMPQWKIPFNPTHLNPRQQEQITHRQRLPASA